MISVNYLRRLYEYNSTINQQLIRGIEALKNPPDKIFSLLAHLLTAEKIWMMRLMGEDLSGQIIWPHLSLTDCANLLNTNQKAYTDYLEGRDDRSMNANIVYTTSKGATFETPIVDILMHVIMHGGYHRGQINALIRQAGGEPDNTDYIHYVRFMI